MEDRELDRDRDLPRATGAGERPTSAGPANTPPFEEESAPTGAAGGEPMEAIAPAGPDRPETPAGERSPGGAARDALRERADQFRYRAENRINQTLDRAAEGLEDAARLLDRTADRQAGGATGARAQAGRLAHSVADSLDSVARYLRDNDAQSLQHELERQVRANPVQTLLIGVTAGWIVGKILR